MSLNKVCRSCIMDTSDPDITFDKNGVCNYCTVFRLKYGEIKNGGPFIPYSSLEREVEIIKKKQRNNKYDVIVGLSGGVDSSYTAVLAKEMGLRAVYVHFDSGWNSAVAVKNIQRTLDALGGDLYTDVCNWSEMKVAQKAFFINGEINCDIPQDHAFLASLIKYARELNVPYIFSGHNMATEYVMPMSWGYTSHDAQYIRSVVRTHTQHKLQQFPFYNAFSYLLNQKIGLGLKFVRPLNHIAYDKELLQKYMSDNFGWESYGVKHGESKFTNLFQSYYLVKKFGIDKRRAHLSSSILSGLISREDALEEVNHPPFDSDLITFQLKYFSEKLGIDVSNFNELMSQNSNTNQFRRNIILSFMRSLSHRGLAYSLRKLSEGNIKFE